MKALLLHVPRTRRDRNEIMAMPMGLLSIASFLARGGVEARVVHAGLERRRGGRFDPAEACEGYDAALLPLHWTKQAGPVLEAAARIKKARPGIPVVVGGFAASFFHDQLLRDFPQVDYVIRGDGEVPAARLLDALEEGRRDLADVPNLTWRAGRRVEANPATFFAGPGFTDRLDHAAFELMPRGRDYLSGRLYADFDTRAERGRAHAYDDAFFYNPGRGCPLRCSYCGGSFWHDHLSGAAAVHFFSPRKALRDLAKARAFGARTWRVSFDPGRDRRYWRGLFAAVKAMGLGLRLVFDCFHLPDEDLVAAAAGAFTPDSVLAISAECGSEAVRERVRGPRFSNDELLSALRLVEDAGLNAHLFLSSGLPFETEDDVELTRGLIRRVRRETRAGITVCPMELDPGSPMFLRPDDFGVRLRLKDLRAFARDSGERGPGYSTRHMSEERIKERVEELAALARR